MEGVDSSTKVLLKSFGMQARCVTSLVDASRRCLFDGGQVMFTMDREVDRAESTATAVEG